MKKTLIALAVAASAVVSGSAMAADWKQNGTGGSVELGGTLTPVDVVTPWEVKVGTGIDSLATDISKGQTDVSVTLPANVLVLGIRSSENFVGQAGISPQINYNGAVDVDSFDNGLADLVLDVKDSSDDVIGSLSTKIVAAAELTSVSNDKYASIFASQQGSAFFGGIAKSSSTISSVSPTSIANSLDPTILDNYNQGASQQKARDQAFSGDETFAAFYAAGLLKDNALNIKLTTAPQSSVQWKVSLPVTVSYQ